MFRLNFRLVLIHDAPHFSCQKARYASRMVFGRKAFLLATCFPASSPLTKPPKLSSWGFNEIATQAAPLRMDFFSIKSEFSGAEKGILPAFL